MRRILSAAGAATFAMAATGGAAAADQKIEQVRVEATRILTTDAGKSYTGFPVKNVSLSYEVNLDDVDLKTANGLATAESRINNAAAAACKEIGTKSPESTPANMECTQDAARGPLAKVRAAAAKK